MTFAEVGSPDQFRDSPDTTRNLPLNASQTGIWFADQIDPADRSYVVAHYLEINGDLQADVLVKAIHLTLSEADTIHASFSDKSGEPRQTWLLNPSLDQMAPAEIIDLSRVRYPRDSAEDFMRNDLATAPLADSCELLYRHSILKLSSEKYIWYQRYHHLCVDGYAFTALTKRIISAYNALANGEDYTKATFRSFSDVIEEERAYRRSEAYDVDRAFWSNYLNINKQPASLSTNGALAKAKMANAKVHRVAEQLDQRVVSQLLTISKTIKISAPEIIMAAITSYYQRMTQTQDAYIGIPLMRRMGSVAMNALGTVVNVLPLRIVPDNNRSICELAQLLSHELKQVRRHQRYDAESIQRDHALVGTGKSLYGPTINFKLYDDDVKLVGVNSTSHVLAAGPVDDIEFGFWMDGKALTIELAANPAGYELDEVKRHIGRLIAYITELLNQHDMPIQTIGLLAPHEKATIKQWSEGPTFDGNATCTSVVDLFHKNALLNSGQIAVVDCEKQLTFAQLSAQVSRFARYLIAEGIGPNDIVATALPRRAEAIVAMLGVLEAGAAWMPLDPDYPIERLNMMCDDARPILVVSTQAMQLDIQASEKRVLIDDQAFISRLMSFSSQPVQDHERTKPLTCDNTAYIIYTSGSTGAPKGVMVPHQGLRNLALSHAATVFGTVKSELKNRRIRACHAMSLSFDTSWDQIIWMLLGNELHLCDEEERRDPLALIDLMDERKIDTLDISPSMMLQLINHGLFEREHQPHFIQLGGEAVSAALWRQLNEHDPIQFYNFYGPTEYSVDTLIANVADADTPTIGKPLGNTKVFILNTRLEEVPIGVTGEIYISGDGLAQGYLGKAGLTASRFIANPFEPGKRMYRTGDLARWGHDGQVIYLGRSDHQVKLRGFRVEPGEIEHAMNDVEGVTAAVVLAEPYETSLRLLAWFTGDADEQFVLRTLQENLPDYMVPSSIQKIDAWPMNVNGKVERKLLPRPNQVATTSKKPIYADNNEKLICGAIASVIGQDNVHPNDDFFSLGGDSISAMALCGKLRQIGLQLRPRDVFTLRNAARMKSALQPLEKQKLRLVSHAEGEADGLPIVHWMADNHGINSRFSQAVLTRVPAQLSRQHLEAAIDALMRAHPALRAKTSAKGLTLTEKGSTTKVASLIRTRSISVSDQQEWINELDAEFAKASASLDPAQGKMLQVVHLQSQEHDGWLMLVIHHLVVDGVSWRILLSELQSICESLMRGETPQIPREETSIVDWSNLLKSQQHKRESEYSLWKEMVSQPTSILPVPLDQSHHSYATAKTSRSLLDKEITASLLNQLPSAYRATVEEILLTAVTLAFKEVFGVGKLRMAMESHGRDTLDETHDVSRTIGWFTSEYPVTFNLDEAADVAAAVRAVKQGLRQIPDHGIGFGILRYLNDTYGPQLASLEEANPPEVLFNYLGRFSAEDGYFTPQSVGGRFADAFAVDVAPHMALKHAIEMNVFVEEAEDGPQLAINWTWADGLFDASIFEQLKLSIALYLTLLERTSCFDPALAADTYVAAEGTNITPVIVDELRERHGKIASVLPLLPLQEGLLFHTQLESEASRYNSLTRIDFGGAIDQERLQSALDQILRRYPQLAARFDSTLSCGPRQIIPLMPPKWPLTIASIAPNDDLQAALWTIEQQELERNFSPAEGSLVHASLALYGGEQASLFINIHHLVIDGWSTPVLLRELLNCYDSGDASEAKLQVSFAQVINELSARDLTSARQSWQNALSGAKPTLLFGTDQPQPTVYERELVISHELEAALLARCKDYGLTLNTLMQGMWAAVLSIMTGRKDVIFGTPVSGRAIGIDGLDNQIGLFSNTVPIRIGLMPERPLLEQLATFQATQGELFEHDGLSLTEIQSFAGGTTLFDTLLVSENYPQTDELQSRSYAGLKVTGLNNRGYTHYPLTMMILREERLRLLIEYRDLLTEPDELIKRIQMVLEHLAYEDQKNWAEFQPLTDRDRETIAAVNATEMPLPPQTLRDRLIEQARATPDSIALTDSDHALTYAQLRTQIAHLASQLRSAGAGQGSIVAVAIPRSIFLTIAIHAVIEIGAAYLPLDTGYPDERLALMIEDAQPAAIITTSAVITRFNQAAPTIIFEDLAREKLVIEPQDRIDLSPDDPAYLIYTSGSTGKPKGVLVSHKAIVNRLAWMQHEYRITSDDVILQKTPASFDVSVWEFFWPLMQGARLHMAPVEAHRDPSELGRIIHEQGVSVLHFVPSMLAAFLDWCEEDREQNSRKAASLRLVFCSGEALPNQLAKRHAELFDSELHNLYGPTEAAVDVTYKAAAFARADLPNVPIGRPVWNTQLRILDGALRDVPIGTAGDLYLTGIQLADYYLGRADLTATRFVADPKGNGERMYRTGDIARWLPNGDVDYLGRSDDQLKIRGQRIELGEIEAIIKAQPNIINAVVNPCTLVSDGNGADQRQLVGYVVCDEAQFDAQALKDKLATLLPPHMVPIIILRLDALPLSANGKLDRRALPIPEAPHKIGRAPQPGLEAEIADEMAQLLGLSAINADDDFFQLGGHSILAMRLTSRLRSKLQLDLSVGQVMAAASAEKLAKLLSGQGDQQGDAGFGKLLQIRKGSGNPLFCIHPASGFAWQYSGLSKYLADHIPIIGLQSPRDGGVIAKSANLEEACEAHLSLIRSVQPKGPYHLLGYSLGGTLAQGIAAKLTLLGEQVDLLVLLDTYPPEGQDWSGDAAKEAETEAEKERVQFLAATDDEDDLEAEKDAMFSDITANYADAVTLLSKGKTPYYNGDAMLFVATKTLPAEWDVMNSWRDYLRRLYVHRIDCAHEDILDPETLKTLGPILADLVTKAEKLG